MTTTRLFVLSFIVVFFACMAARLTVDYVNIQQTTVSGCPSYVEVCNVP